MSILSHRALRLAPLLSFIFALSGASAFALETDAKTQELFRMMNISDGTADPLRVTEPADARAGEQRAEFDPELARQMGRTDGSPNPFEEPQTRAPAGGQAAVQLDPHLADQLSRTDGSANSLGM